MPLTAFKDGAILPLFVVQCPFPIVGKAELEQLRPLPCPRSVTLSGFTRGLRERACDSAGKNPRVLPRWHRAHLLLSKSEHDGQASGLPSLARQRDIGGFVTHRFVAADSLSIDFSISFASVLCLSRRNKGGEWLQRPSRHVFQPRKARAGNIYIAAMNQALCSRPGLPDCAAGRDFQIVWGTPFLDFLDRWRKDPLLQRTGLRRWLEPPRAEARDFNSPLSERPIESVRLWTNRRASTFGPFLLTQKEPNDSNVSIWVMGPLGILPGEALFSLREGGSILGEM